MEYAVFLLMIVHLTCDQFIDVNITYSTNHSINQIALFA